MVWCVVVCGVLESPLFLWCLVLKTVQAWGTRWTGYRPSLERICLVRRGQETKTAQTPATSSALRV